MSIEPQSLASILSNFKVYFTVFDSLFDSSDQNAIASMTETEFVISNHYGIGAWIRSNWVSKDSSTFISFLRDGGAKHMDDISSIILTCYYRYLKNVDLDLEGQLEFYKNYWLIHSEPAKENYPEGLTKAQFYASRTYSMGKDKEGCFHLVQNMLQSEYWFYDYYFGWERITKEDADRLFNCKKEEILSEITRTIF